MVASFCVRVSWSSRPIATSPRGEVSRSTTVADRQQKAATDEQGAGRIRAVEFGVLPGLVQIPDYARRVLNLHADLQGLDRDVESAVATRMARQSVLYDTSKSIEILWPRPRCAIRSRPPR
jgi:hypothetical protein